MANDITTLAIEIQSQEAERNLRTFNELLSLSSQTAQKMEKVSIEIDVQDALAQLQALKAGYDDLAASAQNLHLDMGGGVSATGAPTIDTEALNALKEFFTTSAEMSKAFREELEQFSEAVKKLEADTIKVSSAGGKSTGSMRGGAAVSREYAAALRELCAAQKEMEKAAAQADEAMKATIAADQDAEAVKKRLSQAERELATVSAQLAATHRGMGGDAIGLSEKEEYLKNKVAELKSVYAEAQAAAEKFNQKLEASAEKADLAAAKYKELKAKVESMPKESPMGGATSGVEDFSAKIRLAGRDVTKLVRGISGIASMAGGAIPGVAGLGRAISMFGMVNPYVAAAALAIGACVAVYKEYDKVMQDTAVAAREMAAEQAKLANSFKKEAQERQTNLDRLAVLNSYENLYDVEKEESRRIVEKLTGAYKGLGIQYDALTGKVSNLAEVTRKMSEQDRQALLAKQEAAVEMARSAATTQLAESQRNSVGWFKNVMTMDYPGGRLPGRGKTAQQHADAWYDYINSAKDLEEQIKRVNEAILHLDKIRQRGGADAWYLDAKNFSEQLKKSREQLLEYQKQWKILKEMRDSSGVGGGRSEKAISESLRAREAKLQAARNASKTPTEKYEENVAALERLYAKRQELAALDQREEVGYGGKKITAAEALLDIETEITNRTRERLAYEKQLEALTAKIEAQKRLWNMDEGGNIVSKKSDAERRADRNSRIDELQNQIRELKAQLDMIGDTDPAQGHQLQRDIAKAQLELNALQQERIADAERARREAELADTAKKRLAEARKAYIIDADGNIVRKKTSEELAAVLAAEVAAAKQRAEAARKRAAEAAANEQAAAQAEAELAALRKQQAELAAKYNARKKSLPETGEDPEEDDPELARMGDELAKLKERIEEAKRRAEEARIIAETAGIGSDTALRSHATKEDLLNWGKRFNPASGKMDGDQKNAGWRGVLSDGKGGVMTEVSVGTEINGKEVQIPLIVPESTKEDLKRIAAIANGELTEIPDDLLDKAIAFAQKRIASGKSAFYNGDKEDEQLRRITTMPDVSKAEAELTRLQARILAEKEALDAAKRRAEEAKRGLVFDQQGNIVREQTQAELAKALQDEIDAQRDKVSKLKIGTKERYEAEAELTRLLRRQYDEQKQAAEKAKRERQATGDAKKRADDAKKGFVWDAQGNIVRRKNEAELAKEREKEIAAAKAKVAATKAGTKERYEAEAELRRLQAADFAAREQKGGDGSLGMMKDEQKVNSNLVKGVDAKSSEALALQARNFTRGSDPEKKVETSLKEIEKLTAQIRDFVTECKTFLDDISTDSNDIANKIVTL